MSNQEQILSSANALIEFINACPSPYHVAHKCREMLLAADFIELSEKKQWKIQKGGRYFLTRNQSSVIAFAVGKQFACGNGFTMIAAHTDSPCLQLKPKSKIERYVHGYLTVGVQCYGGGIWSTWFDRDLTIAGRVLVKNGEEAINHRLLHVKKPILRIPNLCSHLQTDPDNKINKERHTAPIIATKQFEYQLNKSKRTLSVRHHSLLVHIISKELECNAEDLLDMDLCLADTQDAVIGGAYDEFIYAPRLDNLMNTYCALKALIDSLDDDLVNEKNVRFVALYDNEEVGSKSAQGADSMLTENVLRRICSNLDSCFEQSIANSFLLSADQMHAVHPNYPEKHEDNHRPMLHGGLVVEFNASQNAATTAITSSLIKAIAKSCNVPLQYFVVRNDSSGGSTVGPILSAKLGVRTVDIGGPQLAMHSIREMCCTSSVQQNLVLFKEFLQKFHQFDSLLNVL